MEDPDLIKPSQSLFDVLDENSPFWKMSAEDFLTERFEIVVFLEGTVESTGMCTQVRKKKQFVR